MQYSGVPTDAAAPTVEAGIVALKSRSVPVAEAVEMSLRALEWLQAQGCQQFLFKYCSTFDSTPDGNIGPVAEALADALQAERVIVCPVYPSLGRTLHQGHLFVGDKLLSESGMQNHPLNPMTDPDIRRWLGLQTNGLIGHIPSVTIASGRAAIRAALDECQQRGARLIVTDAVIDNDLIEIGAAATDLPLLTGGSGIALGLPQNFRDKGLIGNTKPDWHGVEGPAVVLSGSCSVATRAQVARHRKTHATLELTADAVMTGQITARNVVDWYNSQNDPCPLVYSSADPAAVATAQNKWGRDTLAGSIEKLFGDIARTLVDRGVTRLVLAGGETSGAVIDALNAQALEIGPEIDPGVPAIRVQGRELALALKSGNFGAEDFFERAIRFLDKT